MPILRPMLRRMMAALLAGLACTVSLRAADGSSSIPERSVALTIRKQVNEVNVSFIVEDGHKRLLRDVTRDRITVLDGGQSITKLTSFGENSDLPLRLALLLDCSDSMRKGFSKERAAAQAFVERMLRPDIDSLTLIDFAGQST
ncbi:MAG: hypothetical protein ACM34E_18650, partial [Acidobacteriota bacterium]